MFRSMRWTSRVTLGLIVTFGAVIRATGFSRHDLWFDDAWVAVPARVPLSEAVHLVNTTPLFSLLMRSWIGLWQNQTWWAQLPAYVAGLAAIVAVYRLLRFFHQSETLSLLAAGVIAVSPIVVDYSTRLKQYNLDILFACGLLVLFERWRREGTTRQALQVGALGALSLLTTGSTIAIIAPMLGLMVLASVRHRVRRIGALLAVGGVVVTFALEWAVWLGHLSHGLFVGWRNRGYLLDLRSTHRFWFSLQTMGSQFFHWMIDLPTGHRPDPDKHVTNLGLTMAVLAALFFLAIIIPSLWALIRRPFALPRPTTAAALSLAFAIALGLAGKSPLGGGRTDEVLYPGLVMLSAVLCSSIASKVVTPLSLRRGLIAISTAAVLLVGTRNTATYPSINLRDPVAQMQAVRQPNDWVIVDPWLGFTWAAAGISETNISRKMDMFGWSQGYYITGDQRTIFSSNYFFPSWEYPYLQDHSKRLWYVAETGSWAWPKTDPTDKPYMTRNLADLIKRGWMQTGPVFTGDHVQIFLMEYLP
jgi:hypothetical protein